MKNGIMSWYEKTLWYGYESVGNRICSARFGSFVHRPRTSSKPTLIGKFQKARHRERCLAFSF